MVDFMTLDDKLDHFYSSVIDSATKQNIEIIEEYKKTLSKNFDERKEAALRKAESNYRIATDNIIREKNRKLSGETVEIRRKILDKTEEITGRVFADVKDKLVSFMKTPEYVDLLASQIKNAKDFASGDTLTVYINPTDADKKASLEEKTGVTLTISDRDFLGGVRAVIPSHSILIDHSFLTKLEEAKSSFTL
jgi:V/A-type H+/Na+-transporting ATPase subunit E